MSNAREIMLIKVSATENNNKFYHVVLDDNGQVTKRWGRVGSTGSSSIESGGDILFERTVREKKRKGYVETAIMTDSVAVAETQKHDLATIAKKTLVSADHVGNPLLDSLIERLVRVNAHQIITASAGKIKINADGRITTPLGLLTPAALDQAGSLLTQMDGVSSTRLAPLLEQYLTLVPQKVGARRGWHENFFSGENTINHQRVFLDQLRDSLKWAKQQDKASKAAADTDSTEDSIEAKYATLFRYNVSPLDMDTREGKKIFKEIDKFYNSSKNSRHSASNLKLKRVFVLNDPKHDAVFDGIAGDIGNIQRMWHGSRASNVLSILRQGLYCPPASANFVTGRLFGNGTYASRQSTKALGYSHGFWSSGPRENNCFMFLGDFAMGNMFEPRARITSEQYRKLYASERFFGKVWNSINVEGGTNGVLNHEAIIWNTDQIALRYLCEFDV